MTTTHLKIQSNNPDVDGNWFKQDVEDEMRDVLGREPKSSTEWIEWVFSHVFAGIEFGDENIIGIIAHDEWITDITLFSKDDDKIRIVKW